jgi:regulator of cell morphogenesis and NO signaling
MLHKNLIKGNDLLADVIHAEYETLSALKRFKIPLGFGDASISQICESFGISEDFFLEIINIYYDKSYFPTNRLKSFSIRLITDFLIKSHKYYNDEKILSIESKIEKLEWNSPDHERNLAILKKFFNQYKNEVKEHTDHEEEVVYPYAIFVEESFKNDEKPQVYLERMKDYSITNYAQEHDDIEEKLTDLKNIIIKYLPAPTMQNTLHEILNELFLLQNDLANHGRIEEKILVPKILEMEDKLRSKSKIN